METIETVNVPCYFCGVKILVAKTETVPTLHCSGCYSKHSSKENLSEIRRKRLLREIIMK